MTPWQWHVGSDEDVEYENCFALGPYPTKTAAIIAGKIEWPEQVIVVIEARTSTAAKYYQDPEFMPFVRTRNREEIQPDYRVMASKHLRKRAAYWLDRAAKQPLHPWWQFWRISYQYDYLSMASEMDILADEMLELGTNL